MNRTEALSLLKKNLTTKNLFNHCLKKYFRVILSQNEHSLRDNVLDKA